MNFKKGEVLFFNKPLGWTSFKVVGHARYHICRRIGVKKLKVGHAGTLDPLATGVMIVCTGKATKRIEEFQYHTKEYIATLRLGATTPSYDLEHERCYLPYRTYHTGDGGRSVDTFYRYDRTGSSCLLRLYGGWKTCL